MCFSQKQFLARIQACFQAPITAYTLCQLYTFHPTLTAVLRGCIMYKGQTLLCPSTMNTFAYAFTHIRTTEYRWCWCDLEGLGVSDDPECRKKWISTEFEIMHRPETVNDWGTQASILYLVPRHKKCNFKCTLQNWLKRFCIAYQGSLKVSISYRDQGTAKISLSSH